MSKNLVIVESPGKIKTIQKYLDSYAATQDPEDVKPSEKTKFKVVSSFGHVRDLPKSGLNIDPEDGWKANYQVMQDKAKVITELRNQAKSSDHIYLATDLDREGEAIAWHLREVLGGPDERYRRVVFNEITEAAIHEAFSSTGKINQDRVDAQQARRFLDRVVGYKLSPLLMRRVARNLSAGRVQSVAVRIVVEREREIRAFRPEEYWTVSVLLAQVGSETAVQFEVDNPKHKKYKMSNETEAQAVVDAVQSSTPQVESVTTKRAHSKARAPFITSTLQQTASTRLGYNVSRTMRLAQQLYEAGLITYMRTDSTNISKDASDSAAKLIKGKYGEKYLPEKRNVYKSKSNSQEAHEAIRPSDISLEPTHLNSGKVAAPNLTRMNRDAAIRLYDLIWRRFIASQMSEEVYDQTTVVVDAGGFELKATGRQTVFDGHTVLGLTQRSKEEVELPSYKDGESLDVKEISKAQHFTKPPPRYSEARLVRELENRGIGRPSTYASIISIIQDRGYVTVKDKRFYAERIGEIVTDRLTESFKSLLDYEFTAGMEEQLDKVSLGNLGWTKVLNEFYSDFSEKLKSADDSDNGMRQNAGIPTDVECKKCGRPMDIRIASTGMFLGCSGYQLKGKEQCKTTQPLEAVDEIDIESSDPNVDQEEAESKRLLAKRVCSKCNEAMDSFLIDETRKLYVCANSSCQNIEIEEGKFRIRGYEGPVVECNKCHSDMQLKAGRFGKYFGCTNEACRSTRKLLNNGEPAAFPVPMEELKVDGEDDHFVLREGKSGIFLGASKYPKVRVIRAPRVKELAPHANEIDPKFKHLLDAPVEDSDGHDTFVKFARKSREHFLISMDKEKPTKWRAFFSEGKWSAVEPPIKAKKGGKK